MKTNTKVKSALIAILILTTLLWTFVIPGGSAVGSTLAGMIIAVAIACYCWML